MEPVKIYPNTNLHVEMPEQVEAFFAWMRSNGVDPNGVPMSKLLTIERNIIDFWWYTKATTPEPEGAESLERTYSAGEYPLSHLQIRIKNQMPEDLQAALQAVNDRWQDQQANLKAKLYGLNDPCPKCGHQR